MDEVFDYQVVEAESHTALTDRVKTLIGGGWQPYGPMVAFYTGDEYFYYQPMVRYRT